MLVSGYRDDNRRRDEKYIELSRILLGGQLAAAHKEVEDQGHCPRSLLLLITFVTFVLQRGYYELQSLILAISFIHTDKRARDAWSLNRPLAVVPCKIHLKRSPAYFSWLLDSFLQTPLLILLPAYSTIETSK